LKKTLKLRSYGDMVTIDSLGSCHHPIRW